MAAPSALVSRQENLKLVKQLEDEDYSSLAFLNHLASDVEWWAAGPPGILPWAGTFRGRDAAADWVRVLRKYLKYDKWEPFEWVALGDTVVEFVRAGGQAKTTGRRYESEIVRVWTVRDGKVVRVRSYYDTAAYVSALRPLTIGL